MNVTSLGFVPWVTYYETTLGFIFYPLVLLTLHPTYAFIFAGVFFIFARITKKFGTDDFFKKCRTELFVCGIVWLLYGAYEIYMYRWALTGPGHPIRVDLFFLGPFLFSFTLVGLIRGFKVYAAIRRQKAEWKWTKLLDPVVVLCLVLMGAGLFSDAFFGQEGFQKYQEQHRAPQHPIPRPHFNP